MNYMNYASEMQKCIQIENATHKQKVKLIDTIREFGKCFINMEIQLHFDASAYSVLGN